MAGDAELVAYSTMVGQERGFLMDAEGRFTSDVPGQLVPDINDLATKVFAAGGNLTLTAVPRGSGRRMAVDRDLDGIRDRAAQAPTAKSAPSDAAELPPTQARN